MAQLWHILKKDCRYLRFEFLVYALFLGWYAWNETHVQVQALGLSGGGIQDTDTLRMLSAGGLIAVAAYLVVRMVHAEAIPGDNQFWLTRPYAWKSLLGAKVLLLLGGVSLPLLAVRLAIFRIQGFPLYPGVWQLLWSHLVLTSVIALAIAALAALTSGLVQFVVPALVLVSIAVFVEEDANWVKPWPAGTPWIRETFAAAGLIAIAVWALRSQYRYRKTPFARGIAVCAFVAVGVLYFYIPWSLAMTVNGWLTAPMSDSSSPRVVLGPQLNHYAGEPGDYVNSRFWITIRGIPAGYSAELQQPLVTFDGPGGPKMELFDSGPSENAPGEKTYRTVGSVDRSYFDAVRWQSMTVRVSVDLILFPPPQSEKIQLSENFENFIGGVQCRGASFNPVRVVQRNHRFDGIECRSAFDWPEVRLFLSPKAEFQPRPPLVPSHSPFYNGLLTLSSVQTQKVIYNSGVDEITFSAQGPPQWYHRDFEYHNVQFNETMDLLK